MASQTLSVYFLAFRWRAWSAGAGCAISSAASRHAGGTADLWRRHPLALLATQFGNPAAGLGHRGLRRRRGFRGDQTMLRDSYQGSDLARVFSVTGHRALPSPVLGLVSGGQLASGFGYLGVFSALLVAVDCCWSLAGNCRKPGRPSPRGWHSGRWPAGWCVIPPGAAPHWSPLFNTMLFGYYSLAPFLFAGLGLSAGEFGYSGILLALATLVAACPNKRLLGRGWCLPSLIRLAAVLVRVRLAGGPVRHRSGFCCP